MISSTSNGQVKKISALQKKSKARKEEDVFVVEGIKMFQELPKERLVKAYVSESFLKHHKKELEGITFEMVSDDVYKAMSDTQTPQGILAVVKQYHYTLDEVLNQSGRTQLIILDRLQDPGNLGTILRAGEGAGVTGIIMSSDTADIYNPKVIRSTMGSIYRIPFVYSENLKEDIDCIKKNKIHLFAAHLKGRNNYEDEDYTGNMGFLIGNEANGLSDEVADMADTYIKIPMLGKVESLNAAVAASVLMYESARQRRLIKT